MTSATGSMDWQFAQVFGDKGLGEEPTEADIISAVEFDETGDNLAIGDRGGRVVILKRAGSAGTPGSPSAGSSPGASASALNRSRSGSLQRLKAPSPVVEYKLYTEFQSHSPEFDYLKSVEIEEKINQIKFLKGSPNGLFMLTTNDKTIKLWKVFERSVQNVSTFNIESGKPSYSSPANNRLRSLRLPRVSYGETVVTAQQKRVYGNGHAYHINSISLNSDGETFLSADDLRINLWHVGVPNTSFNIVDIKPNNMEDLNEVVTTACFHPQQCNSFIYTTSRGIIKMVDMRQNALCDNHSKMFESPEEIEKSYFTEIVCSISDAKFTRDGRYILTRDFLTLKLWDVNMESRPLRVINVHDQLRSQLCTLYENDSIFDRFECAVSGDGSQFLTGSYANMFYAFDHLGRQTALVEASKISPKKKTTRSRLGSLTRTKSKGKEIGNGTSGDDIDYTKKVLHTAWHPTDNIIACASLNYLYVYNAVNPL
eukprot:ANDGO_02371.mRNA.1 Serine/threonine protein phosphatase 2A 55 kDa regulatory subunit B beta isoform